MQGKFLLSVIFTFFLSFSLNYYIHHNLLISLFNSLTLFISICLIQSYLNIKSTLFNNFLIISLSLIPLFNYKPFYDLISLMPLISAGFLFLYKRFPIKWLAVIFSIFLFVGNLISSDVIKFPLRIEHTQLILNTPEIIYNIKRHQSDSLFLPYTLRGLVFTKTVFIYAALNNFFNLINLKNLTDILLVANVYPFLLGAFSLFKQNLNFKSIFFISALVAMCAIGIDRSADKFESLYLLEPFFIYLIILGSQRMSKIIYSILFILSIFILINPKI